MPVAVGTDQQPELPVSADHTMLLRAHQKKAYTEVMTVDVLVFATLTPVPAPVVLKSNPS